MSRCDFGLPVSTGLTKSKTPPICVNNSSLNVSIYQSSGVKKSILKKVQNARAIENERLLNKILQTVNNWLLDGTITMNVLQRNLNCVKRMQEILGFKESEIIIPSIIYAGRYVQKNGKIPVSKLFNLLLIASVVSLKFWEQEGKNWVDLKITAHLSGLSLQDFSAMERNFLHTVEFSLFLTESDITNWKNTPQSA